MIEHLIALVTGAGLGYWNVVLAIVKTVGVAKSVAFVVLSTFALYLLFIGVMYFKRKRIAENGHLKWWEWSVVIPMLVIGYPIDIVYNIIIGTVLFKELPQFNALTFSARIKMHEDDTDWRGVFARWVCKRYLRPYDPTHC